MKYHKFINRTCLIVLFCCCLFISVNDASYALKSSNSDQAATQEPDAPTEEPVAESEPLPLDESIKRGLMPRYETQAAEFLERFPDYNGNGVVVAIFDTGVDPGAIGLSTTPDGQPKIVDMVDGTGVGDVDTSKITELKEGKLEGLSGRTLTISSDWKNPTNKFHLGMKRGFDLFPTDDSPGGLKERIEEYRHKKLMESQELRRAELLTAIDQFKAEHKEPNKAQKAELKEFETKLEVLETFIKKMVDTGPVFDCVVFHDGEHFRAVVDTDEDGDLAEEKVLTNYRTEKQYATFADPYSLNFAVNIYEEGKVLSIVCDCGSHGTHVAGIVAAYHPEQPELNGVAPGAQIVSVKIGDTRLKGMETAAGLIHGVKAVIDNKCDLVNMSFGEESSLHNQGFINDMLTGLVYEHNVIFVSSAGNAGPALSTVGAPGGTSSAILGIGAFLPPDLMRSGYTFRKEYPGIPFTWTSRGPTLDGDLGVDLLAPGGAIAPMPTWLLQKHELFQGTSMASPNACGCIALMLSAAKGEQIKYSPASVKRALTTSAQHQERATPFDEGAGLIQTLAAYESLKEHAESNANDFLFEVNVPARKNARGIYLREHAETIKPFLTKIAVEAILPAAATNDTKIKLEVPVRLESTVPWIHAGEFTLLTHGANLFEVQVDAQDLEAGSHYGEVRGYDKNNEARGALFHLPVTIIKPHMLHEQSFAQETFLPAGEVQRFFVVPPVEATTAHVKLTVLESANERTFMLHALQLLEGKHFAAGEDQQVGRYVPGKTYEYEFPIEGGRLLEYCIGHYWNDVDDCLLRWEISFHGIKPSQHSVSLHQGVGYEAISVLSGKDRPVNLKPKAELTKVRKSVASKGVKRHLLDQTRYVTLKNLPLYKYEIAYEFTQQETGEVTPLIPQLEDQIYDALEGSYFFQIKNGNEEIVASNDMYPDAVNLAAGDYKVTVSIINHQSDIEDNLKGLVFCLDRELASPVKLSTYASSTEAAARKNPLSRQVLEPKQPFRFYLTEPTKIPKEAHAGDMLMGTIAYDDPTDETGEVSAREYHLSYTVSISGENAAEKKEAGSKVTSKEGTLAENLKADLKQLRIKQLKALTSKDHTEKLAEFKQILEQEFPLDLELNYAFLEGLDSDDDRENRLEEIITKCHKILEQIKIQEVVSKLSMRQIDPTDKEKGERKELERQQEIYLDILYRRVRAIGYRELPEVIKKKPIADQAKQDADFEQAYKDLATWVDPAKDKKYTLVEVRKFWRMKEYAQALKTLLSVKDAESPEFLHLEKEWKLLSALGWHDLAQLVHDEILLKFPKETPPWKLQSQQ